MPEITNLSLFVTAALVLLLTPGPAVLFIVARSVEQGRKAGIVSVLGLELGTLFHVFAAALGISAILLTSALAFDIVKYLGAAYLIYMGIRALMTKEKPEEIGEVKPDSLKNIFRDGVIVNILNPKTALFFFAFLPQFVDASKGSVPLQMLTLGLIFALLATLTDGMYAVLAGTAGSFLKSSTKFKRALKYISGTTYIGLGVTTALASAGKK